MSNNFTTKNIGNQIKKNNIFFRILKLLIWIFIIGLIFIYNNYSNFKNQIITNKEVIITIKSGDNLYDIGKQFNLNTLYFKYYVKHNFPNFKLNRGKYKIEKYAKLKDLFTYLKKPISDEITITILEGRNIFDIDNYLIRQGLIKKGEYINYSQNKEKINKLTEFFPFLKGVNTLEGFLYPDTYKINKNGFAINKLVIKQLNNFENKVYNKLFISKTKLEQKYNNETILDVIKLASIVEKEEKNTQEKSTVAGILKKRLNSGWKIGADITVCYPHQLTANECKMVISKYINEKSKYNTRTMIGLPKTPIGNPSYETINATLNDKKTEYRFYLHNTKTGKIYYGKTNEEHLKNKRLYLK